jgi:PiT family inorganic phosphate transporter
MSFYFLCLGFVFCLLMTWGVGANDLANVMSTSMGSKSISVKQAILIALVFEIAGAFIGGTHVTSTMRDKIINTASLGTQPTVLMEGMLSVLVACTIWMNLASFLGLPVSITNALVGSMVGFGALVLGPEHVHWNQVGQIAISWISSPLMAGVAGYLLFTSMQISIFAKPDPLQQAKRYLPIYTFLVGSILSFITVFNGLQHAGVELTGSQQWLITVLTSLSLTILMMIWMKRLPEGKHLRRHDRFVQIEKYFAGLMGLTTCAMVFAHGSNDVALAVGPLSMLYTLSQHSSNLEAAYPSWIMLLGCLGVIAGFLMYGKKVIETVGSSITALTPSRAFAATLAASTTVVLSTSTGIPVSATQTLVGAVFGVGLARGIGALNLIVIRNIFMSWIFTLPAACLMTILSYLGIHLFIHG